jgi:AcrR family transcriptional regulator
MTPNRLTSERILAVAAELIETAGLKSFSMRKLAEKLGVDPMAVYHYFPNKASLLDSVLDQMLASMDLTIKGDDWKQDLSHICQSLRNFALDHPQIFLVYSGQEAWSRSEFDFFEAFYRVLLGIGLPKTHVVKCTRLVVMFVEEYCYSEAFGWFETETGTETEFKTALAGGDYPSLRALAKETVDFGQPTDFQYSLDVIFAGIEAKYLN